MALRNLNLRSPLYQFRNEVDRLFNGFLVQSQRGCSPHHSATNPPSTFWEQDDALVVELEVPGVKRDQLDLSVVGNELSIRIDRPDQDKEEAVYHRRERPVGNFSLRDSVAQRGRRRPGGSRVARRRADDHLAQGGKRQAAKDRGDGIASWSAHAVCGSCGTRRVGC